MTYYKNDPGFRDFRTKLRKKLTPAEAALWNILKKSKIEGRKFRRQYGVGKYVLDFYCPSERLGIELDGYGQVWRMFCTTTSESDSSIISD